MNTNHDEYAFVIKPSKFAHSDGRLDMCNTTANANNLNLLDEQQKINSCSALIQANDYSMRLKTLTLNQSPYVTESWYYGLLSREEAEKLLKYNANEKGDFLIRDSERRVSLKKFFSHVIHSIFVFSRLEIIL